jgi:predicted double-glycine peptidase
MRSIARQGAMALLAALAGSLPARAQMQSAPESRPEERLVVLDVPYVAQSAALCGGAAVAMLLRYWGERNIRAEDFGPLVTPAGDGIRAADLVDAVRDRGWFAQPFTGDGAIVRAHVEAGRPIITLIEVAPAIFHYVVLVAWAEDGVLLHDPALAPFRSYDVATFMRAWSASGYWSLIVQPHDSATSSGTRSTAPPAPPTLAGRAAPTVTIAHAAADCTALLDLGVAAARRDDLATADRVFDTASERCPGSARVLLERAGLRFRQERYHEAAALAEAAVAADPTDAHAFLILAASRFLLGDAESSLDAWNRAGTPALDLTTISGLERMRFRVVADAIGIVPGQTITSAALRRARRRVLALPAVQRARVDYKPAENGLAEIDVAIAERPAYPRTRHELLAVASRLIAHGELQLDFVGIAGAGERWQGFWRWSDARPALNVSLSMPGPHGLGVWALEGGRSTESYALDPAGARNAITRRSVAVGLSDWISGHSAWNVGASVDHWDDRGAFGSAILGGRAATMDDDFSVAINLAGWAGSSQPFGRVSLDASARIPVTGALEAAIAGTFAYVSNGAPRDLWSGAGTGHGRTPLLRAHPLLDRADRISSDFFAPGLFSASIEARRWLLVPLPGLSLGVAGFLDAAAVFGTASARNSVDAGAGMRVRLGDTGILRIDFAVGITERARAFSLGFQPSAHSR